jgi:hypothetical protein
MVGFAGPTAHAHPKQATPNRRLRPPPPTTSGHHSPGRWLRPKAALRDSEAHKQTLRMQ